MKVLPALLHASIETFSKQLHELLPYFDRYSIDIQDGKVVPTETFTTSQLLEYLTTANLPHNIIFDFDLMTYDYALALEDIKKMSNYINIGNIVIFKNALHGQPLPIIEGLTIGISLNPPDEIEDLDYKDNINKLPTIQLMTIYAGPQGQAFIPEMLKKIGELKTLGYRNSIYLDGSINDKSIPVILTQDYKPDFICVGSYLSKAKEDFKKRVNYLKSIENN